MSYTLWATDGANLIGSYEAEAGALEVVADLWRRYRSPRARNLEWLALDGQKDGSGEFVPIASGPALVAPALGAEAKRPPRTRHKRAAA